MSIDNLGEKIRRERQARGFTQEQLAEQADISVNFMSLIENGRNMSVDTLVKIASALGVTADYLLYDDLPHRDDSIAAQINLNLNSLSEEELLFFLNMIKQYKSLGK